MNRIRMMDKKYVEKLRNELVHELYKNFVTEKIKFDLTIEELEDIIFEYENPNKKKIAFEFRLIKKIDLSGVDFTNVDISGLDLVNCTNQSSFLGNATATTPTNVPYNCEIIVANQTQKNWMTTNFSNYTNVRIKGA